MKTNSITAIIGHPRLPRIIEAAGTAAQRRFLEFFAAQIRNPGTRAVYYHAVNRFFEWCDANGITQDRIEPLVIATYIEGLTRELSAPTVKLHLAAIRMLFDFLVTGQVFPFNPAASVRGPKHVVRKGKTPVLSSKEARQLLNSIEDTSIIGLRDRAIISVMLFSFGRVSAVLGMNREDYFSQGRRMWFRLHEKGGKLHDVPAHHAAEDYLDKYLSVAGFDLPKKSPLFRTVSTNGDLTEHRMHRTDALRMMKRRAEQAGISTRVGCHSCRATGITAYLQNGGTLEHAMQIACHESARTTKLYDRTSDEVSLDEIERIRI